MGLYDAEGTPVWHAGSGSAAAEAHVVAIRTGDGVQIECNAEGGACNVVSTKFDGVDVQGMAIVSGATTISCEVPGGSALHLDAVPFNAATWSALGEPSAALAELGA